jgi:hypothetical protein
MTIRYSYDDFTTKGHGVIEGYVYSKSSSGKRKVKSKKDSKAEKKNDAQSTYNHLMSIHRQAEAERNYKDPIPPRKVLPAKYRGSSPDSTSK